MGVVIKSASGRLLAVTPEEVNLLISALRQAAVEWDRVSEQTGMTRLEDDASTARILANVLEATS